MMEDQKKVLEELIANDPHPERGEIEVKYSPGEHLYFCRNSTKVDGKIYEEWHSNGQPSKLFNYTQDRFDGSQEEWWKNGQKKCSFNCVKGKLNGSAKVWYENGQLQEISNFQENKLNGVKKEWYPDGQLKSRENYSNGRRNGLTEWWYRNGQLHGKIDFKEGQMDGLKEISSEDGKVLAQTKYKEGKQVGNTAFKEIETPICRFLNKPKPSDLTPKVKELGATIPNRSEGGTQTKAVKNNNKLNKL